MPIPLTCPCGRALRIKDELAGRKIRCPACKDVLTVPRPARDEEDEALDFLLAESPRGGAASETRPTPTGITARRPEPPGPDKDEGETGIRTRPGPVVPPPRRPADVEAPPRPPRKRQAVRRAPRVAFEQGWFGSVNAGVVGGLLMMLIAVVWFFGGLAVGIIFFYPPILFFLGVGAIIRGLTNR